MNITENRVSFFNSVESAPFLKRLIEEIEFQSDYKCNENYSLSLNEYKNSKNLFQILKKRYKMYLGHTGKLIFDKGSSIRVTTTNPFYAPFLSAKFGSGRIKTVNLVYDLYPDAMEVAGVVREKSIVSSLISRITSYAIKNSDVNVFLGERLKKHAETRYGLSRSAKVIYLGGDGTPFRDKGKIFSVKPEAIRILYSGQIGRMQDGKGLVKFAEYIEKIKPEKIRLDFYGYGPGYETLKRNVAKCDAISINGGISNKAADEEMINSQLALITLIQGAEKVGMPSRTYTSMLAGQAILAICSKESDLADLIKKHDCGWVIDPDDKTEAKYVLDQIANPDILLAKRTNAYEAAHMYYDVKVLAKQWIELFDELLTIKR